MSDDTTNEELLNDEDFLLNTSKILEDEIDAKIDEEEEVENPEEEEEDEEPPLDFEKEGVGEI
ncbi:MAG: hypothetical protein AAB545_03480 [Patescibacteria group bacterium]